MKMRVILDSDDVLFPCNEVAVDHLNKAEGTAYTLNDIKRWGFLGNKLDKRLSFIWILRIVLPSINHRGRNLIM